MRATSLSPLNYILTARAPGWVRVLVGLVLLALPVVAAILDGTLESVLVNGHWRPLLLPVSVIYYIWLLVPVVERGQAEVIRSFRPVAQIDDAAYERLVSKYSNSSFLSESLSLAGGGIFGLLLGWVGMAPGGAVWLRWYWVVASGIEFALIAWVVFGAVGATRLTAALHRQPLRFDLFDLRPFEPVGRQSLLIALVFAGGLAIALLLGLSAENVLLWQTWLIYIPLGLLPALLFFLNMRGTHTVLAVEKRRLLSQVAGWMTALTTQLQGSLATNQPFDELAARYAALNAYEGRLLAARTWPYNTVMIRTLAFTVVLPLLIRLVTLLFFEQ